MFYGCVLVNIKVTITFFFIYGYLEVYENVLGKPRLGKARHWYLVESFYQLCSLITKQQGFMRNLTWVVTLCDIELGISTDLVHRLCDGIILSKGFVTDIVYLLLTR